MEKLRSGKVNLLSALQTSEKKVCTSPRISPVFSLVCEKHPEKCVEKLRSGKVNLLFGEMRRKFCVEVFS